MMDERRVPHYQDREVEEIDSDGSDADPLRSVYLKEISRNDYI